MKENILEFYVNKFCFLVGDNNIDISFIPPILRRKTSLLDKLALSVMNKAYSDNIQNIVFSSQFGEVERLLKIIEQYSNDKEVSPSLFSASVHNYPAGFFLQNIKKTIPYTALSAMDTSISSGLIASVISNYNNVLYCYCDVNDGKSKAFAVNLSKNHKGDSLKFKLILKNSNKLKDGFEEFVKLFTSEADYLETQLFKLEKIK